MRWDELHDAVKQYQTGVAGPDMPGLVEMSQSIDDRKAALDARIQAGLTPQGRKAQNDEGFLENIESLGDVTEEVRNSGYGDYRKDYDIDYDVWKQDPINIRANSQSNAAKIGNGIAKILPYAASTYLDNTVGMIMGIANMAEDATNGGEFHPLNSFISTPFAETMQRVRDWSEQVFPNYRTTEELEDADRWWRHLNANFWGDTFLKNLGFTIGAAFSGLTYTKGMELLQRDVLKNAYRGAIAASTGDQQATSAFMRLIRGGSIKNPKAVYDVFGDMAEAYSKLGWQANLIGGIGGAIGESRVEAINAADEHMKAVVAGADEDYNRKKQDLIRAIASNRNFTDENGDVNALGRDYYQKELTRFQNEYKDTMDVAEQESRALANTVFMLNMPLLTASNIVMFGRMYSGGYGTQAKNATKGVLGSLKPTTGRIAVVTEPLKNTLSEGFEELSQKVISEGAKDIAHKKMSYFHDKQYDKNAFKITTGWLKSMLNSAGEVLIDPQSWEEFTVGALTGALGMPSRNGWSGGIIGGVQEARQNYKNSKQLADELNAVINDKTKFRDLWLGLNRIVAIENEKDEALKNGDKYAWKTGDDEQMLAQVMLASRAGVLDQFEDYVKSLDNIDASNIDDFKKTLDPQRDADLISMPNDKLVSWVKKRVDEASETINQYHSFYDAIDFMSFGTSSESAIEELIFTEAQLKKFEGRYNDVLKEVWSAIKPRLEDVSKQVDNEGKPTKNALEARKLLEDYETLGSIFGGTGLEVAGKNVDEQITNFKELDDTYQTGVLATLEKLGTFTSQPELKKKVEDLQKLVRSRQDFYVKLFDPTNLGEGGKQKSSFAERHQKEAKTDDGVANNIKKDASRNKVSEAINQISKATNFNEYINIMESIEDLEGGEYNDFIARLNKDPKLKVFAKRNAEGSDFINGINNDVDDYLKNIGNDAEMSAPYNEIKSAVNDVVNNFAQELQGLTDNDDISYYLANKILEKIEPNTNASRIALSILRKNLNDKDLSDRLGSTPEPQGEVKEEKEEKPEDIPADIPEDNISKIQKQIEDTTDINDTTLNRIANNNFSDFDVTLTQGEQIQLAAMAVSKLAELNDKLDGIATNDSPGVDELPKSEEVDEDSDDKSNLDRIASTIRGYALNVYDYELAKRGIRKKQRGDTESSKATLKFMNDHKVQEFIDSGALVVLNEHYKGNLPVYFLGNPHYVEDNWERNPFVTSKGSNLLLAIEMNEENRTVLSKYEGKDGAGVWSEDTLLQVYDGGKYVPYLVIGQVFNPNMTNRKWTSTLSQAKKDIYGNVVKPNANFIWEYAMRGSILHQYDADKGGLNEDGRWYVAKLHQADQNKKETTDVDTSKGERITTTINYILPGRQETKTSEADVTVGTRFKHNLGDSLRQYKDYGGEYHIGFLKLKDGYPVMVSDAEAPIKSFTVPSKRKGSAWIATRGANGVWDWSYLRVARTDEVSEEQWKSGGGIFAQIRKSLDIAVENIGVNPTQAEVSFALKEKWKAIKNITNNIYMGVGVSIYPMFDDSGTFAVNIAGTNYLNTDDAINALRRGRFRFQVDSKSVTNTALMNQLIDSGVFLTDRVSFVPIAASFGVNPLTDKDSSGNTIELTSVKSKTENTYTAPQYVRKANAISNIPLSRNESFSINTETDEVLREINGAEPVVEERPEVIAQVKTIASLMHKEGYDAEFPGSDYIIERKGTYTELYERQVGNVVVHVIRTGANGAYLLCGDEKWADLIKQAKKAEGDTTGEDNSVPVAPSVVESANQEQGPKQAPKAEGLAPISPAEEPEAKTVEKVSIEDMTLEDAVDC